MDAHIQSYLRTAASRGRDTERVGPFLATFDPDTDHPFLNYAMPDDGAAPSHREVAALVDAYERRRRKPRLEYLPRVAPAVEAALVVAGFAVEDRPPLMTCAAARAPELPAPHGIELVLPLSDPDFLAAVTAQREAFGGSPPGGREAARLRATVAAGGIAVLARDARTGEPAGAGVCSPPGDGVTELAGIGVRHAFRRRGIAGAITARLAREAFAVGVTTAFLTPGDDGAGRVYGRAGFVTTGEMLHISRA